MANNAPKKRELLYFDDWYKIAEEYYNEHGCLLVPVGFVDPNGKALGRWIATIRSNYKNPKRLPWGGAFAVRAAKTAGTCKRFLTLFRPSPFDPSGAKFWLA